VTGSGDTTTPEFDDEASPARPHPVRWTAVSVGVVLAMVVAVIVGRRITESANEFDSPLLGEAAPAFDLPRIDGDGTLASYRLRGRTTIVNFWATWCVPCRRENPHLDDFYQRWEDRDVELVGILYGDTASAARRFRAELGGTWPLVDDPVASTAIDFGVTGVPETYVIDENGIVVAALIGGVGPTTLDDIMAELAAGANSATYTNLDDYRRSPDSAPTGTS